MIFIQLVVYLRFAKFPFAVRRLFELHEETQDARIRAIFNSKSTALTCLHVSPCFFELLCCFAACLAFPYSGASFLEAAKMDTLQSVR